MSATLGVVQYAIGPLKSKTQFWQKVTRHIQTAQARKVKLLVFPEYLTAHLLALEPVMNHSAACAYLDRFTDEYLTNFSRLSRESNITILGGTHIHKVVNNLYNTAFLFFPDGQVIQQHKIHLTPEERNSWQLTPGDSFTTVATGLGQVSILTCYDIEFPESGRIVANQGAQLILCPSYTDTAYGYNRVRYCCQARAIENQLYVALSGIVGKLPHVPQIDSGYSHAGVFAPCDHPFPANGVLAIGRANQNSLVCCQLDLKLLQENRERGQVAPFYDRQPEIYARYPDNLLNK